MSRFVKLDLGEHGTVLVEVETINEEELVEVGSEAIAQKTGEFFDNVLGVIKTSISGFVQGLKEIEKRTKFDEFSIEFGVSIGADVGAVIAKSSSEANFKVSFTWKSENNGE